MKYCIIVNLLLINTFGCASISNKLRWECMRGQISNALRVNKSRQQHQNRLKTAQKETKCFLPLEHQDYPLDYKSQQQLLEKQRDFINFIRGYPPFEE